jgi:hypothetical protein
LITLGEQSTQLVRKKASDARLLQVDTDLVQSSFRFGQGAEGEEIYVRVPTASTPSDQWTVRVDPFAKPAPGIDLHGLRVGPSRVAGAMLAHWPDCANVRLTLFGDGSDLHWTAFCDLPEGVVSARVDNDTVVFEVLGGPAQPAPTALP